MRVLMLGDGVNLTTGFAAVLRHVAAAFVARGWEVAQIASLDGPPYCDSRAYHALGVQPYFPGNSDVMGTDMLRSAVDDFRPDALFLNCDPGGAMNWYRRMEMEGIDLPSVFYGPIEGAPIPPSYASAFRSATRALTYTKWSAAALADEHDLAVPWVYHGVDTDVFRPIRGYDRHRLRQRLGWEGKYVVTYVARNAGRKSQDRLLKALRLLHDQGMDDVRLYLHCAPYDGHNLMGWDLAGLAHWCGVTDWVSFAGQSDAVRGEESVSLARKLAVSDLYVHPAKVEGFGLPILEAMACGVPVAVTNDYGNMAEVVGDGAILMDPSDIETWFTGAQLYSVLPETIAATVAKLRTWPQTEALADRGYQRALSPCFEWTPMQARIVELVEQTAGVAEAVSV